jgi:hypothetical protein
MSNDERLIAQAGKALVQRFGFTNVEISKSFPTQRRVTVHSGGRTTAFKMPQPESGNAAYVKQTYRRSAEILTIRLKYRDGGAVEARIACPTSLAEASAFWREFVSARIPGIKILPMAS